MPSVETVPARVADAAALRPSIRAMGEDDLAAVAALFLRLFRPRHGGGRSLDLEAYLRALLFRAGRAEGVPPALVSIAPAGTVQGFVACSAPAMRFGTQRLVALNGGTLMLDPAQRGDAMALIRLLRAFFLVPHDVSFTDTASAVSRSVIEKLGGTFLPLQSVDWLIVGSRAGFVLRAGLDRARIRALDGAVAAAARTLAGWRPAAATRRRPGLRFVAPEPGLLEAAVLRRLSDYALRPDWETEPGDLAARIAEASGIRRHGTFVARVGLDAAGAPVACWIASMRAGGIARVLQVMAAPGETDAAVADLVAEAGRRGCVAVRGRLDPLLVAALTRAQAVFVPRLATLIRASDPALTPRLLEAPALLTGLAGETWSRIFEDDFA